MVTEVYIRNGFCKHVNIRKQSLYNIQPQSTGARRHCGKHLPVMYPKRIRPKITTTHLFQSQISSKTCFKPTRFGFVSFHTLYWFARTDMPRQLLWTGNSTCSKQRVSSVVDCCNVLCQFMSYQQGECVPLSLSVYYYVDWWPSSCLPVFFPSSQIKIIWSFQPYHHSRNKPSTNYLTVQVLKLSYQSYQISR